MRMNYCANHDEAPTGAEASSEAAHSGRKEAGYNAAPNEEAACTLVRYVAAPSAGAAYTAARSWE